MDKRALSAIRFLSPKLAQEIELREKEISTRPAAYRNAFEVASVAGPMKMAEDLGIEAVDPEQIAKQAARDYSEGARHHAEQGTLDGFEEFYSKIGERVVNEL